MLPKIDLPKYKHKLFGLNKTVEYRPFTVKEQKILLQAKESEAKDDVANAVKQILDLCTFSKLDVDNLAFFDVEDLFLRIRAKSAGNIVEVAFKVNDSAMPPPIEGSHEKVSNVVTTKINLDDVHVVVPKEHKRDIKIDDKYSLRMQYPTIDLLGVIDESKDHDADEIKILKSCIEYVYDEKNVYPLKDSTDKEIDDFIDSLDAGTLLRIQEFFKTMPRVRHTVDLKLPNGEMEKVEFIGISDFF